MFPSSGRQFVAQVLNPNSAKGELPSKPRHARKLARIKRVDLRMRQALELRLGSCANQFRQIAEQLGGAKPFDIRVARRSLAWECFRFRR